MHRSEYRLFARSEGRPAISFFTASMIKLAIPISCMTCTQQMRGNWSPARISEQCALFPGQCAWLPVLCDLDSHYHDSCLSSQGVPAHGSHDCIRHARRDDSDQLAFVCDSIWIKSQHLAGTANFFPHGNGIFTQLYA